MKQDLLLNNYFVELYDTVLKKGFECYYNTILSFNTRIDEKLINIEKYTRPVYDNTLGTLKLNKVKYSSKEYKKSFRINIIYSVKNYSSSEATIHFPINYSNLEKINLIILQFIIKNKINCNIRYSKINQNDLYIINFFEYSDAQKILNLYNNEMVLIKERKNRFSPIFLQVNEIGISSEIKPYSYINTFIKLSYMYLCSVKKKNKIKFDDFYKFVEEKSLVENNILYREHLIVFTRIINKFKDNSKCEEIFNYNGEMNLGSIDPNEFSLSIDNNKLVNFVQKEGGLIIGFGSEDYLNLSYSKIYRNIIGKSENLKFYNYFNNIYLKMFQDMYANIDKLFDFRNINSDNINQQLMINACGYFGLVKYNLSLYNINKILSISYAKNLNIEIEVQKEEFKEIKKSISNIFPFSIEYGNKIIDTISGEKTSIIEYYRENNVLDYINSDSIVTLKDGKIFDGESFLKFIEPEFSKHESFKQIVDIFIEFIEIKQ